MRSTVMRYMKEILLKNKKLVLIYIVIGIFNSFLANYKADYFQKIIDGLADGSVALSGLLIYGTVLILNYLMNYIDEYPGKKLEQGIFLDFKLLSLRKISKIDYAEYQTIGTGKLTQRIENGAHAGKDILYDFWFCLIRQLIPTIAFSMFFIWRISKVITCAILIGYVIIFIITNLLLKALYQIKGKILSNEEKMNHFLVRGFMEMVVFRFERQFTNEIEKASNARNIIVDSKVKMSMIHEAFFTFFALMVAVLDVGILIYAWMSQSLSIGSVVALIALIENAYTPIAIFNVNYVQYKLNKATFNRFESFLDMRNDDQLDQGQLVSSVNGNIDIEGLTFKYGDRILFDQLSLSIKQGEKVAFVGESGSGKSTLVKLLTGLLKYDAGSIKIEGQEVKEMRLNSLYEHIKYIPQNAPIFDGSLKENLIFNGTHADSDLYEVLAKVQLKELLETMSGDLETPVGEKGARLSGGEKQRLALARLWFDQNQIIILDEATSAMDNITEESVMDAVMDVTRSKTVIAIAHRLSSIKNFDKIVVFKQGEIIAQGKFDELMQNNTYFNTLYNSSVCTE